MMATSWLVMVGSYVAGGGLAVGGAETTDRSEKLFITPNGRWCYGPHMVARRYGVPLTAAGQGPGYGPGMFTGATGRQTHKSGARAAREITRT
jgi:hypothetical protein